jgi:hypothetical protein
MEANVMTKRIVSGIFILTALGALGVILAGALTSGEQLIVRFLTAVIVAALGLYVISDLRLQADEDSAPARAQAASRLGTVDVPPNSTAAFMATVTRRTGETAADAATESSQSSKSDGSSAEQAGRTTPEQQPVGAGATSSSMSESSSGTVEDAESGSAKPSTAGSEPGPQRARPRRIPAPATIRAQIFGQDVGLDGTEAADSTTSQSPDNADSAASRASGQDSGQSGEQVAEVGEGADQAAEKTADKAGQPVDEASDDLVVDLRDDTLGEPVDSMEPAVIDLHEATVDLDSLDAPADQTLVAVGGPVSLAAAAGSTLNGNPVNGNAVNGNAVNGNPVNGHSLNGNGVGTTTINGSRSGGTGNGNNTGNGGGGSNGDAPDRPDVNSVNGGETATEREAAGQGDGLDDGAGTEPAATFEYSDDLNSPDLVWPTPTGPSTGSDGRPIVEPSPFERASQAYEAEKKRLAGQQPAAADATRQTSRPGNDPAPSEPAGLVANQVTTGDATPAVSGATPAAVDYAAEPNTPVIDLRAVDGESASSIDAAINVGEVEVIATLIDQGMLSTDGPITDRDVRTMVYVAFTSNELRKLLMAGGSPEGPNHGLELGPVELFDERVHAPAPKRLYSGAPRTNP